ncbi:FadR/GntR family transcriptional regulator [Geminicoccus flavidas]|uniref:FadR/GntR family transcriptional regulator n=1 Tax=Geminicoccus flavidas TaxID=2506407 RepID=UPI001F1F7152|nr:FCD domain-containing protein [Geminicoccus flavidas]
MTDVRIERLTPAPAYQAVSRTLERLIMSGQLKQGEALPSETELAGRFGVNRSTVREGIRQLEAQGLLRRDGRKRLLVSRPGQAELAPSASRAMLLEQVTFRELWEVALALEPLAAGLAAERHQHELLQRLEANLEETEAAIAAGRSMVALDTEFHSLVAAATLNRALILAREPIGLLLYPACQAIGPQLPQSGSGLVEAHRQVVAAIGRRDRTAATTWMAEHITDLRRAWELARLDPDGSPTAAGQPA